MKRPQLDRPHVSGHERDQQFDNRGSVLEETSTSCHLDQIVLRFGGVVLVIGDVEGILVVGLGRGRGALFLNNVDDARPKIGKQNIVKVKLY